MVLDGDDVDFIESTDVQRNAEQIANVDPTALSLISESSLDLFDGMMDWLKANRA